MSVIHPTSLNPTKLELLTPWLPTRPWFHGAGEPDLAKAGGFRLDDPRGEVGIEFIVTTDNSGAQPVTYLVPLTYRGAPLDGAEHALVGTMEHGVLGRRWAYDACHDPVAVAQLFALIEGRVQAQDQNISDTPDHDLVCSRAGDGSAVAAAAAAAKATDSVIDDREGTALGLPQGGVLRLRRVLRPAQDVPSPLAEDVTGHISGSWRLSDGTMTRGLFAVLNAGDPT
ncbi:1,4-alpha-glucan branching protein [Streptomyces sp. NPDC048416]|uniref:maltokinase N-terminal cap-like domain-containing protein n=1 Tax=Streptomyces sp. NPDC048416 TaxID=3365546 RepID=UPI0037203911